MYILFLSSHVVKSPIMNLLEGLTIHVRGKSTHLFAKQRKELVSKHEY
jgi:hypothetical protein